MDIIQFWQVVEFTHHNNPNHRYGQTAFNVLSAQRPDLADKVRGTDVDPFYVTHHLSDARFLRFCDFLLDNWGK